MFDMFQLSFMVRAFIAGGLVGLVAPMLGGQTPVHVATAAAIVGTSMFAIGLLLSFLLTEPKEEKALE